MVDELKTGTRQRLLAAAESLLLTEPYDEVSVRGICTVAGANSAAVHYHFGSKETLVGALIEDRCGPMAWRVRPRGPTRCPPWSIRSSRPSFSLREILWAACIFGY